MAAFRNEKKPYNRPAARPGVSEGTWLHDKAMGFKHNDNSIAPTKSSAPSSGTKLMVSNLHYELTPKDLTAIFGQYGTLVREPMIRYDRSGRSSGVAIIFYETAQEAAQAKQEFNGKFAKGQPMEIEFDAGPTPRPNLNTRHAASAPSLINRIQKPPLLERLGDVTTSKSKAKPTARPAKAAAASNGPGPVRTKARPVKEKKKPKTMEQLDSELDAFMHDDNAAPSTGDVAMA